MGPAVLATLHPKLPSDVRNRSHAGATGPTAAGVVAAAHDLRKPTPARLTVSLTAEPACGGRGHRLRTLRPPPAAQRPAHRRARRVMTHPLASPSSNDRSGLASRVAATRRHAGLAPRASRGSPSRAVCARASSSGRPCWTHACRRCRRNLGTLASASGASIGRAPKRGSPPATGRPVATIIRDTRPDRPS
jgi:hypothetical protein